MRRNTQSPGSSMLTLAPSQREGWCIQNACGSPHPPPGTRLFELYATSSTAITGTFHGDGKYLENPVLIAPHVISPTRHTCLNVIWINTAWSDSERLNAYGRDCMKDPQKRWNAVMNMSHERSQRHGALLLKSVPEDIINARRKDGEHFGKKRP